MRTKWWAIALVFLSTLSSSFGQILIKTGVNYIDGSLLSHPPTEIVAHVLPLAFGYGLYAMAAVILLVSLKHGDLSVLYPIYAMNFIWVALMVPYFFPGRDSMNAFKWAGVIAVVLGVALIGLGSGGEGRD